MRFCQIRLILWLKKLTAMLLWRKGKKLYWVCAHPHIKLPHLLGSVQNCIYHVSCTRVSPGLTLHSLANQQLENHFWFLLFLHAFYPHCLTRPCQFYFINTIISGRVIQLKLSWFSLEPTARIRLHITSIIVPKAFITFISILRFCLLLGFEFFEVWCYILFILTLFISIVLNSMDV